MNLFARLRLFSKNSKKNNKQQTKAHKNTNNTSTSEVSDQRVSTSTLLILSPDSVFKHTSKLNVSSQNNSKAEITLEASTLELMYSDKNIFSSQIIDQNFLNKSDSFLDSTMSSVSDHHIDITINETIYIDTTIQTLHGQIRLRFNALRYIATQSLNIENPVNIAMLESIYDMKMKQLTDETNYALSKFDRNNLRRPFFNTLSVAIKGLRHRSKSVEKISIKDYYKIERDVLQRKFENKIRFMQYEILSSIKDLELHYCTLQESILVSEQVVTRRPRFTTENPMEKRIRKRNKHRSCSHSRSEILYSGSASDSRRSSFGLDRSVVIPDRYRNNYAEETMV